MVTNTIIDYLYYLVYLLYKSTILVLCTLTHQRINALHLVPCHSQHYVHFSISKGKQTASHRLLSQSIPSPQLNFLIDYVRNITESTLRCIRCIFDSNFNLLKLTLLIKKSKILVATLTPADFIAYSTISVSYL